MSARGNLVAFRPRATTARRTGSAGALLQCAVAGLLVLSIVFVASIMFVGFAHAQSVHAFSEPDTSLVAALLAFAVVLMGGLSAVAVRLSGRPRQR